MNEVLRALSEAIPVLRLRTWLVFSHLFVLFLPLVAVLVTGALASDLRAQTQADLEHQGALVAMLAHRHLVANGTDDLSEARIAEPLMEELGRIKKQTLAGIRVTDANGIVVATSGTGGRGIDLSEDADVAAALDGEVGLDLRPRSRTRAPLSSESRFANVRIFVATPVFYEGDVVGVVAMSRTPREEIQALYHMSPQLSVGAIGALLTTIIMAFVFGQLATRSLTSLAGASNRIAEGSLDTAVGRAERSHLAEVRSLAGSFSTMTDRLQERLAYITEFAGNVAHEFKTPLSTLKGTVELILDDEEMPHEQRVRFLRNAMEELERMDSLVDGLLALAKAEEGRDQQLFPLSDVVDAVLGRHPTVERGGKTGWVHGNADQLEAVLDNLVENALIHGGDRVRVQGFQDARTTGFEVWDDGDGISTANLPQIFDRFFTTRRGEGGTGLGLALVRAVCRAHGGDVTVRSAPGDTGFRVELPRRQGH